MLSITWPCLCLQDRGEIMLTRQDIEFYNENGYLLVENAVSP